MSTTTTGCLDVRGLDVTLRSGEGRDLHLVRDVTFSVGSGERFGLIGESGCGKTTTLMSLMGLLGADATVGGEVRIDGTEILGSGERDVRRRRWSEIAVVFQGAMNSLNPVVTIGRQIAEAARRGAGSGSGVRERVHRVLELVGLRAEVARRYPHELSGGMRQRVAIAMAVVCEPRVLLADEPTTALDVIVQAQVLTALENACAETGAALVLVSHDMGVIGEVCDRAAVMYGGEIVETGRIETLLHEPAHPYTRLLVDASPRLSDPGRELASIPGAPPRPGVDHAGCGFAPRCPDRFEPCGSHGPALLPVATALQQARCHLHHPPAEEAP
ncbi:ABC transporter ATP-binding protein [Nocardioides sp. LHD-245]|uniref:ABC transporter ATP-binding protein n=1 Tax=Nocardioides sp. LHD-245 TaxID=3051387 RepID=UPI0027E000B1|nr:ABC transporter ATP-binding protein [Nocardioides sp. LHD-245]